MENQNSNFFTITGFLFEKEPTKNIPVNPTPSNTDGIFRVRNIKVELRRTYNGKEYKELPEFKLMADKCFQVETINIGEEVTINFSLGGRYSVYKDKTTGEDKKWHRTELVCQSIKRVGEPVVAPDAWPDQAGSPAVDAAKAAQIAALKAQLAAAEAATVTPSSQQAGQTANPLIDDNEDLPF